MAGRTWLYSDPHFFHHNIVTFKNDDGTPLRPFTDAEEMSEKMIFWYNELVDDEDRVYLLGDIAFSRRNLNRSLPRLRGRKILVKGNHDTDKLSYYAQFVDDIRSIVPKKGFVLSHVPIHPGSLERWGLNIHGHTHGRHVLLPDNSLDKRYANVSVEQTDYRPILLDRVLEKYNIKNSA